MIKRWLSRKAQKAYPKPRTPVRNPRIAAQITAMHERWLSTQFPSRVTKTPPVNGSITSIKLATGRRRHFIRLQLKKGRP